MGSRGKRSLEVRTHIRRHARPGTAGWTMLEVVIATVILLTVVVGFSYGLASSAALQRVTREHGIAREAARSCIEEMRASPFEHVLARFDDTDVNDPVGFVSPGSHFEVPGLASQLEDADGFVGEITFPLAAGELREDLDEPRLGMPRDLTGEGDVDDLDHAADYRLLPVLVRLRWRGAGGNASFQLLTVIKGVRP
jgi:type II secretory pathway pseudopilin PulG